MYFRKRKNMAIEMTLDQGRLVQLCDTFTVLCVATGGEIAEPFPASQNGGHEYSILNRPIVATS